MIIRTNLNVTYYYMLQGFATDASARGNLVVSALASSARGTGSIPAAGEENFGVQTRLPSCHWRIALSIGS